jgi:hypothetical protein
MTKQEWVKIQIAIALFLMFAIVLGVVGEPPQ